jgi:hypothetical protein
LAGQARAFIDPSGLPWVTLQRMIKPLRRSGGRKADIQLCVARAKDKLLGS